MIRAPAAHAGRLAALAGVVGGLLLCGAAPARADQMPLQVALKATNPLTPFVTLTNRGDTPCQVAVTALGTVAFSRLEQGGALVRPIVSYPTFDDRLDLTVTAGLRTLAPGASQQLAVPVLAAGPTGHLVETVSWSAATGPVALLYPVRAGQPLAVDVNYDWETAVPDGGALCGPAAAIAAPPGARSALLPAATVRSGWHGFALVAGGLLLFGLLCAVLLPVFVLRSRHRGGGYAVLIVLAATAAGTAAGGGQARAADFQVDPSLRAAFDNCLATFRQPGDDPAGILPAVEDPNFHVRLQPTVQGSYAGGLPGGAFVAWDPTDTRPLTGPGGTGTGPARVPCATLYHDLFHAKEDAGGNHGDLECVTDAGRSGIGTGEVNATRAENALRQQLGLAVRTTYGGLPLPTGDCHPGPAADRFCTEGTGTQANTANTAGPMCTCRTAACAESTGDPHLLTFDGRRYDFQAAGEFVASRDPAGGFQLQVRQQPYPGRRDVAVTTAVALDVAGDHVEVDLAGGALSVLVDGTPDAAPAGQLPKGGTVSTAGGRVGLGWPDGSAVAVAPAGGYGLSLTAAVAAARAGRLRGLLGDANGDPANDARGSGTPRYADGWRVSDTTSLFTYAVGQGTASYTDRRFPSRTATAASVPDRAAAEAICREVGVSDPAVLAGCVVDVALTGQVDFAVAAAAGQQALGQATPGTPTELPATANVYQCGATQLSGLPGGSGSQPLRIRLTPGATAVGFPQLTGTIGPAGTASSGPDGDPGWGGTDIPATNGLSGIHHATQALFLIGVFLPAPATPPATPDDSAADQTTDFHPALGELFDIGDGHTADGAQQRFAVPAGATQLCLGFADANTFKGPPGYFDDNAGTVSITYEAS